MGTRIEVDLMTGDVSEHAVDLEAPMLLLIPALITRRQCAAELFAEGLITGPEAIAMTATGTPPAVVEAVLATIPEPDQTFARLEFAASTYERMNPLIGTVMTALGKSAEERDAFFLAANAR